MRSPSCEKNGGRLNARHGHVGKAIEIAARVHAGVTDKQGRPYILHPLRVMMDVEGETAQIVAVLHDVVEDTDTTFDDLKAEGFSDEALEALNLVTHQSGVSYADYVIACEKNATATQVKLADLRDNTRLNRMLLRPDRFPRDSARIMRYMLSYRYLNHEIPTDQYRDLMQKIES